MHNNVTHCNISFVFTLHFGPRTQTLPLLDLHMFSWKRVLRLVPSAESQVDLANGPYFTKEHVNHGILIAWQARRCMQLTGQGVLYSIEVATCQADSCCSTPDAQEQQVQLAMKSFPTDMLGRPPSW